MRRLAVVFAVIAFSAPVFAARRVTVEQLEQILTAAKGKPDLPLSQQISDLELTERVNAARVEQWKLELPGEKTQAALLALEDRSEFLEPPAAEIPATAAPDFAEQRRVMGLMIAYLGKTIPRLPNFTATRQTIHFEDTPQLEVPGEFIPYQPLHAIGAESAMVMYRDGREVVGGDLSRAKKVQLAEGLKTWGVFAGRS